MKNQTKKYQTWADDVKLAEGDYGDCRAAYEKACTTYKNYVSIIEVSGGEGAEIEIISEGI